MRDLGSGVLALTVLCTPGPVLSFVPSSFPTARSHFERAVLSQGTPTRRYASRNLGRARCLRATVPAKGHVVSQVDGNQDGTQTQSAEGSPKIKSRWAKGQGNWAPRIKDGSAAGSWSDALGGGAEGEEASVGQPKRGTTPEVGETFMDDADAMRLEAAMAAGSEKGDGKPAQAPAPLSEVQVTKKRLKKYFIQDFEDSSWTLGIQWKSKPKEIFKTKVALKKDGSVVWLDRGKGSWTMRTKSRDLVFYRDFFWNWNGKRIYSAKLLTNTCDLYLEGVIKGWAPFLPLGVFGYFQAVRRGVTFDENTPRPPWEDRPIPEVKLPKSWGKRSNKAVTAPVDLD